MNFVETEEINPKSNDYADVPESLKNAIFYFILATACKYYRGFSNKHSSMLIHVDLKISTHAVVNKSVELFIENIKQNPSDFFSYMEKVWNSEKDRVSFETVKQLFNYSEEDKADRNITFNCSVVDKETGKSPNGKITYTFSKRDLAGENSVVDNNNAATYKLDSAFEGYLSCVA